MKETESHAINMKTCIHKYRDATTTETEREIMSNYKREEKQLQEMCIRDRTKKSSNNNEVESRIKFLIERDKRNKAMEKNMKKQ